MKVNEIFFSIDGEGKRAGQLVAFIRLTGCNLRCSYCDTKYSFDEGTKISAEKIAETVKKFRNVTLTGGEPLTQNCHELLKLLSQNEVNIETNGSIDLTDYLKYKNAFFTMDFKCYSSGMYDAMNYRNLGILREGDVLKFVIGDENDLILAKKICEEFKPRAQIYISPVFGEINPVQIVEFMKRHNLQDWKLQLQLHKIIWKPEERGV